MIWYFAIAGVMLVFLCGAETYADGKIEDAAKWMLLAVAWPATALMLIGLALGLAFRKDDD